MTTSNAIAGRDLETLRTAVTGDVFAPGDHGYDEARQAWNLATDERPAVVVVAGSAADVVQAVRFARVPGDADRPAGHRPRLRAARAAGGRDAAADRRGCASVRIDPAARTARAEAGALWQDVTVPAGQHGLAALAGSSPNVGVTGYTLGGGMGWLARRYGLAANSVTAAEIVTPDGRLRARRRRPRAGPVLGGPRRRRQRRGGDRAGDEAVPGPRAVRRGAVLPDPARRGGAARLARVDRHGPGRGHLAGPHPAAAAAARGARAAARPGLRPGGGRLPRRRGRRRGADPAAAPARPGTRHLRDDPRPRAPATPHGPRPAGARPGRRRVPGRLPRRRDRRPDRRGRPGRRHPAGQHRGPAPGRRARPPRPRRRRPGQDRRQLR